MGLQWLPVRAFWRHPSVSSSDCASCLEGGLEEGWVHRAEGQFLPVPSYGLREAPSTHYVIVWSRHVEQTVWGAVPSAGVPHVNQS